MAIAYGGRNGSVNESTTSPLTVSNLPSGYASGDLFIAQLLSREDNPTPVHGITTGGVSWTQIGSTQFLDIGTTGIALSMWYRFTTSSSESSPSATCPTPNTMACDVFYFTGVDSTTPLDVTPIGGTNAAAATLQPNGGTGITTATNGAFVISAVATPDDNFLDLSVGNGFSERGPTSSAINTDWAMDLATIEKATAGNQTAPTHRQTTLGNDEWAWHLFALRPFVEAVIKPNITIAPSQAVHRSYNW